MGGTQPNRSFKVGDFIYYPEAEVPLPKSVKDLKDLDAKVGKQKKRVDDRIARTPKPKNHKHMDERPVTEWTADEKFSRQTARLRQVLRAAILLAEIDEGLPDVVDLEVAELAMADAQKLWDDLEKQLELCKVNEKLEVVKERRE